MLKAKTTCKRTRAVKKCSVAFRASARGATIGSGADCDVTIVDTAMAATHARVSLGADGGVVFDCAGRADFLIGIGRAGLGGLHGVEDDQIVKMGACSLRVVRAVSAATESVPAALAESGCYICFESSSELGRMLVPSPCTCAKLVHRSCLARWLGVRGTRECSICKARLPVDACAEPPFLVLQVSRRAPACATFSFRESATALRRNTRPPGCTTHAWDSLDW